MTIAPEDLRARPVRELAPTPPEALPAGQERAASAAVEERTERPFRVSAVVLAGALSSAAAAWLSGALVRGIAPQLIALLGVAIGAGVTYVSLRLGKPALQYSVLGVGALVGAVLVTPEARGGTANLPGLVAEAIHDGGLLQPPIPFNPGWRFILVVLFAVVAAAAAGVAIVLRRPKIAVVIPLPIIIGAALLQPEGHAIVASSVATFLVIGALAIAYGADLTSEDTRELGRRFEIRRLLRGGAMLGLVMIAIVVLAQTDFLFPTKSEQRVIPPRRPPTNVPPEADRELFMTRGNFRGPLRVGVLDEYDGEAWLLPSEDPGRLRKLSNGRLPADEIPARLGKADLKRIGMRITDMSGIFLPVSSGLVRIEGAETPIEFDPRTGVPRLSRRLPQGFDYTLVAAPLPFASQLNETPRPPLSVERLFTTAPQPPAAAIRLLARAPTDRFTRLQYLRAKLYNSVRLSGGGGPVEVAPARVVEMLEPGALATPFEVTAAEALLARWAGVPARIGYGYHGGDRVAGGYSFRPKHGRVWLEAYFEGYGWVPLVGTPPKAAASLSQQTKLIDPNVRPSDDLLLVMYVPVWQPTIQLLFEIVRYWALVALAWIAGFLSLYVAFPAVLKGVRSTRRQRWGVARGPMGEVLAAYAGFRDRLHDLNLGNVRDSPVVFVERFTYDEEHDELAWLVTRLLWGDLSRDPRVEDVREARMMVASVQKRILGAQPAMNRFLAATSRASLRDPYNDEVPNVYPRPVVRVRAAVRRVVPRPAWLGKVRRRAPRVATTLVLIFALGSCGASGDAVKAKAPMTFPPNIPPKGLLGLRFVREPGAEKEYARAGADGLVAQGRVYTLHEGAAVQGALQIGVFKPQVDASDPTVQAQIEGGIGGAFKTYRFGPARIRIGERPEQRLYLWFPPDRNAMILMVLRNQYLRPEELIRKTVASVRGLDLDRLAPVDVEQASETRPSEES